MSVLSFAGETLLSDEGTTPVNPELLEKPEEVFVSALDSVMKKVAGLVNESKLRPLAICLGVPGIIDVDKGKIVRSAPFRLDDFDYQKILYERYGIPLFMENDARCCSWLQLALNKSSGKKDFMCVLARTYNGNPLLTYPETYGKGIGIGLSFAMNGRIINGRNYAAGEYISRSWTTYQKGQTGLPEAVLKTVDTVDDSYAEWVKDLFGTLPMMIPLLQRGQLFFLWDVQAQKVYFSPSRLIFALFFLVHRTKLRPHSPHFIFVEKQFRVRALFAKHPSSLRRAISDCT